MTLGRNFSNTNAGFRSIYVIHVYHKGATIRERRGKTRAEPSSKLRPANREDGFRDYNRPVCDKRISALSNAADVAVARAEAAMIALAHASIHRD